MNPYDRLKVKYRNWVHPWVEPNLPEGGLRGDAETKAIADLLGREYKDRVEEYKRILLNLEPDSPYREELTPQEIHNRATFATEGKLELQSNAAEIGWHRLQSIIEHSPNEVEVILMAIREVARGNLAIAWEESAVVGAAETPYSRARFSLMLLAFEDDWQPRGALEQAMLQMLVQYYIKHNHWLEIATNAESLTQFISTSRERKDEHWQGPRLKPAELVERATNYAEKYNRLFMRTLRQMRDLRRYPMVVNNFGGQVNVAADGGQQTNVVKKTKKGGKGRQKASPPARSPLRAVGQK